jgi:hypothetical protein
LNVPRGALRFVGTGGERVPVTWRRVIGWHASSLACEA